MQVQHCSKPTQDTAWSVVRGTVVRGTVLGRGPRCVAQPISISGAHAYNYGMQLYGYSAAPHH